MFVLLRIITLPPQRAAQCESFLAPLRTAAAYLPGVCASWIAPMSSVAAINAGHVLWRQTFVAERDALAVAFTDEWRERVAPLLEGAQVTTVGYRVTCSAVREAGPGIWRALIFRVMPHGFPTVVAELEAGLLLFPKYIPAIRGWALSSVAASEGPKAFTHVWEQEFATLEGLTIDYMQHPVHWGFVDAWFDAEYPQYIVDPYLIQVVGEIDNTLLAN
jgi:hypothetical protein